MDRQPHVVVAGSAFRGQFPRKTDETNFERKLQLGVGGKGEPVLAAAVCGAPREIGCEERAKLWKDFACGG